MNVTFKKAPKAARVKPEIPSLPFGENQVLPTESFETWLLRRVAQAVEAGELPAALLAQLQAKVEAAREKPQEERHAMAVREIAEIAGIDQDQAAETLAAIEAQPTVTQEGLLRRIAEAWLEARRKAYRKGG